MRLRTPLLALCGPLLGSTAAAEVRTPAASFAWEAPRGCPDELELVRQVEALLGERLEAATQEPLRFVAQVSREPGADYRLLLRVSGGSEELTRELAHPSCEKLTEAASLVIALAIDPERVQAVQRGRDTAAGVVPEGAPAGESSAAAVAVLTPAPPGAAAPAPSPPAPIAAAPIAAAPIAPAPSTPASSTPAPQSAPQVQPADTPSAVADEGEPGALGRVRFAVGGGAVAGAGVLPNSSFGAELGLGATVGATGALGAFVELWAPSEEPIPDAPGATLRMRQATLGLRGCWLPELGGLRASGCLAGEVAQLTGEGQDVAGEREDSATWAGIRAELGVLLPLRPGSYLTAGGAGGLALKRPRFGLRAEDGTEIDVFQPSAWYLRGKVGALFIFE